jgi:hypothetical protein
VPRPLAQRRFHRDSAFQTSTLRLVDAHVQRASELNLRHRKRRAQFHAPLPIRFWHLASLDAPTVALTWSLAFAWTFCVHLPWWVLVVLPAVVWPVYIADRLLDARAGPLSSQHQKLCERHFFHQRYRYIFLPAALAAALVAAWIIFNLMPRASCEHDSLLAAASLLYFTQVHTRYRILPQLPKELLVGILFTLGCVLPTWTRVQFSHDLPWWPLLITAILFALLAWLNCYAIDRWESHDVPKARFPVTSQAMSLAVVSSLCSALLSPSNLRSSSLLVCAATSALLFAVLDRFRNRLTPVTLRTAADLALLPPTILLALPPFLHK